MSILRNIKAGWKVMTPVEKFKLVIDFVAKCGCSIMAGDIAATHVAGRNFVENAAITVGAVGLGWAAGDAASKAIDEFVDDCVFLNEMRKQNKAEKEAK